jgi:hypothetical protein
MIALTGGVRLRLLRDSALQAVTDGLTAQGWFDANRRHKPVRIIAEPLAWDEPVEPNLITVTLDSIDTAFQETGSNLTQDTVRVLTDLYVENDTVGIEMANDIRDLFRGRIGTGVARGSLPIWDYRLATPVVITHADMGEVRVTRPATTVQQHWQRSWFTVTAEVRDTYYTPDE